jgi:threonylcarbamoyladenosine tRNA methylthiotransferase MtaB
LRAKGEAAFTRHLESQRGETRLVLTERGGIGRTEQFTAVRLAAPVDPGNFLDLTIADHNGRELLAA